MSSPNPTPEFRCDRCGATDDHPKHVVQVGGGNGFWHEDDTDHDGFTRYHFDCPHDQQHLLDPEHLAAAKAGTHGDALRALIVGSGK